MRRVALTAIACFAAACAVSEADPVAREGRSTELVPLQDTNPDPDIVEVTLVAGPARLEILPGKLANVWAYRDGSIPGSAPSFPGPLLEVKRGDQVIVHLRNELEEGTTVHFHGLRLPEAMDGAHGLVLPGETFEYSFIAGDAGTFWYHPHFDADVQMERGLYGAMHVREDAPSRTVGERILVLDDIKLAPGGELAGDWTEADIAHGREGNVLLVNGAPAAVEPSPSTPDLGSVTPPVLHGVAGSRERWHLINASNGRFYNLTVPRHPFEIIGWDGGLIEQPYSADTLLLAPGERYDVLVPLAASPGDALELRMLPYAHGDGAPVSSAHALLGIALTAGVALDAAPDHAGAIQALPVNDATKVRSFALSEDTQGKYGPLFFINGEIWPFNKPIDATLGDLEIWEVKNEAEGAHPFHLHGMFFQVLSRGSVPEDRLGWKDTVLVGPKSSVRFAVRYDAPGMWMYHCQIPEHAERGMMGEVMVAAP
jgi:FtsP/CotA-like multicopper oxidase with cupredoxin domain